MRNALLVIVLVVLAGIVQHTPAPAPSVFLPGTTTATSPPVLLHPPLAPKGTLVTPPPSMAVPSYLPQQARQGQIAFYGNCAECHGAAGEGNFGPALITADGNVQWQPIYYVFSYMQQHMPAGNANDLKPEQYVDIMAFLIQAHGHPPGKRALTAASASGSGALLGAQP